VASFSLVNQPWLPCYGRASGQRRLVSLGELFDQADAITELLDDSPLRTLALHRLALAVLHRALGGPADLDAWRRLWTRGWDRAVVRSYLRRWAEHFDLFHPERPFFQAAEWPDDERRLPVTVLAPERASGSSSTWWDKGGDADPPRLAPDEAARWLIGAQATLPVGGQGYGAAPLAFTRAFIPLGATLRETLLLNLAPYDPTGDCPVWERDSPRPPDATTADGYTDYLTWPARRVRLVPEAGRQGTVGVRRVQFRPGLFWRGATVDAHVATRPDRQGRRLPVRPRPDRPLWRDLAALLDVEAAPPALAWLLAAGQPPARGVMSIASGGDKAKVHFWRLDRLALPPAYLGADPASRAGVAAALAIVAEGERALRQGLAATMDWAGRPRDAGQARAEAAFWEALAEPAGGLIADLPAWVAAGDPWQERWSGTVRAAVLATHAALTGSLTATRRGLVAAGRGRQVALARLSRPLPAPDGAAA
jgi:CRISPR system Cascade subunit CasA